MRINAHIKFLDNNETYLNLYTTPCENGYDAILESIHSLISLLEIGNHKFDDNVIETLNHRLQELKS